MNIGYRLQNIALLVAACTMAYLGDTALPLWLLLFWSSPEGDD